MLTVESCTVANRGEIRKLGHDLVLEQSLTYV